MKVRFKKRFNKRLKILTERKDSKHKHKKRKQTTKQIYVLSRKVLRVYLFFHLNLASVVCAIHFKTCKTKIRF